MRPVTDKHNVSRAKLAYLIYATTEHLYCPIAPIFIHGCSGRTGFVKGQDGFVVFIKSIP